MKIYATFDGFKNRVDLPAKFKWINVNNEMGENLKGLYFSNNNEYINGIKLKFGFRYQIICDNINKSNIISINNLKIVNKNPRCDIFRRYKDEFHIVGGKYTGKKDTDIKKGEMMKYCIWLGQNSYNEATIKNSLELLKKLHDEHIFSNLDLEYEFKRGHQTAIDMVINKNNE